MASLLAVSARTALHVNILARFLLVGGDAGHRRRFQGAQNVQADLQDKQNELEHREEDGNCRYDPLTSVTIFASLESPSAERAARGMTPSLALVSEVSPLEAPW